MTTLNTATTSSFTTVTFQETFDTLPVVVVLPTNEGTEPATLRIRNVTVSGFEVAAIEPPNSDGTHPGMTIHYTAIEPGIHQFPDGTEIAAGTHSTATIQSKFLSPTGWDIVSLGTTLDATASVVASLQTQNSESGSVPTAPSVPFMTVATRIPSASTFQLALDRAETTTGTVVAEDVGWIAFPSGESGNFIDTLNTTIGWDARITPDNIAGFNNGCYVQTFSGTSWPNARILASKNRRDGPDGGWLRRCSLTGTTVGLTIDEDTTNDSERNHTTEAAALLSFSDSFHANFEGKITAKKTVSTPPGTYSLPGNVVTYKIAAESSGVLPIDSGSVALVDALPTEVALMLADLDGPGSGPVYFQDGTPASGLTYSFLGLGDMTDDLEFSDDGGVSYGYIPTDNGTGSDPDVTHIRIIPKGVFLERSTSGNPNFEVSFDTLIK